MFNGEIIDRNLLNIFKFSKIRFTFLELFLHYVCKIIKKCIIDDSGKHHKYVL